MLSSSSYIFNDIIDVRFDKQHPVKKLRPLAAGKLSLSTAIELAFILGLFGLIGALFLSISFFLVAASFLLLHIFYSLVLKKYAVFDILGIAFSFILRAFAGEILTFYHLPFWLFMTIMFIALFVATAKRHAELLRQGTSSRPTLFQYREKLLDFYTSMFGSASIIAYSLFTFLEGPPHFNAPFKEFLSSFLPQAIDRKWMILTIPFVVFGLMRYAQLAYEGSSAEQPEKIVTTDIPLIVTILLWGLTIVMILYIL
jgi:4-hydroxybenzoate polyprenyltransferase